MAIIVTLETIKNSTFEYMEPYLESVAKNCQLDKNDLAFFLDTDPQGLAVVITIVTNGVLGWEPIAKYGIWPFPDCLGACIASKGELVNDLYKNKGLGEIMGNLRKDIAKRMNYGLMFCSTIESNKHQQKLLEKLGWTKISTFFNKKTNNTVTFHCIALQGANEQQDNKAS